jgi:hypothetical protein
MPDFMLNLTGNRRKILWEPEPEPVVLAVVPVKMVAEIKIQKPKVVLPIIPVKYPSGNGHKSLMTRELQDQDRTYIKEMFLARSGCLNPKNKICTEWAQYLNLSVFQVTGYVSVLHKYIWTNKLELSPLSKDIYFNWMRGQYKMWARYNSDKYKKYRDKEVPVPRPKPRYVHGVF